MPSSMRAFVIRLISATMTWLPKSAAARYDAGCLVPQPSLARGRSFPQAGVSLGGSGSVTDCVGVKRIGLRLALQAQANGTDVLARVATVVFQHPAKVVIGTRAAAEVVVGDNDVIRGAA